MKICVVGVGAIGGWVAAKLALAGEQVNVVARGDTLHLIHSEGLRLKEREAEFVADVIGSDDCAPLGHQDILIVAVKAPALPSLAFELRPLIGPQTTIVPMLNGVPWWFVEGTK